MLLRELHGRLNASWKISSLAVNGQSFLVIDGYLLISAKERHHKCQNEEGKSLEWWIESLWNR